MCLYRSALTLCLFACALPVSAQLGATTRPKQPALEQANRQAVPDIDTKAGLSLGEFLTHLQSKVPEFQVVSDGSDAFNQFALPHLSLKGVTLGQVIQLVQHLYPDVGVTPIESENSPTVYLFTVQSGTQSASERTTMVQAFGLADRVDRVALRNMLARKAAAGDKQEPLIQPDVAARKEALKQIMSLIQAAANEQIGSDKAQPATVQLHEETQTVLVRGTRDQINVVQQTLATLDSPSLVEQLTRNQENFEASQSAVLKQQEAHAKDLEDRLNGVMNQLRTQQQMILERERELTEYKVRLEAAQAKSKGQ